MRIFRFVLSCCLFAAWASPLAAGEGKDAVMVVAHGASEAWNDRVIRMVKGIEWDGPVGAAFLMKAPREHELSAVAGQLERSGAHRIIVVPLLVSSYSNHFEEIRYYVGARTTAPEHAHQAPLQNHVKFLMTGAMDDHPVISQILENEIRKLSRTPEQESIVLVAHGPNSEADNALWIEELSQHAARLQKAFAFKRIEVITLRDDAPKAVRDDATQNLRSVVGAAAADSRVLVVPVLVSVGHIQDQIHERLQGLRYEMAAFGIIDSPLIKVWIKENVLRLASSTGDNQAR